MRLLKGEIIHFPSLDSFRWMTKKANANPKIKDILMLGR
jgi:hypothetical protein